MRGIPQIEVAFDIDANGILHVSAKDLGTKKEQSIKITASTKLDDKEVERMRKEAEQFAEQDQKRREEIETLNEADTLVYSTEKMLTEFKGKVSDDRLENVNRHVKELKELIPGKDVTKIKSKIEEMNKYVQEISVELYRKAAEEQAKTTKSDPTDKKDDVVDADYEVKDKK